MNSFAKLLLVTFILIVVALAYPFEVAVTRGVPTTYLYPVQTFFGEDNCGGAINRIYKLEGSLVFPGSESDSGEWDAVILYEKKMYFTHPGKLESFSGYEVSKEDQSFNFEEVYEPKWCYVPQIGEIQWVVVDTDCYRVMAQKQEFTLIDGPRGVNRWEDVDPGEFFVWEWEDGEAVFPDGSVVYEPEACLIED